MHQIEEYSPPPNPTKLTDSRANNYIDRHGYECWELDALRPEIIENLIRDTVIEHCDLSLFEEMKEREQEARETLKAVASDWPKIERKYGK